jgi:penicillin-binding protein-related factor A (putative recombinase)
MKKLEAQFTIKFRDWLTWQKKLPPAAYEIKATNKKSIPLSAVKQHQVDALLNVKRGRFYYKIPDDGFAQKPFDCFTLTGQAYVVLAFIEPRKDTEFYVIDINEYVTMCTQISRKSWNKATLDKFPHAIKHSIKRKK